MMNLDDVNRGVLDLWERHFPAKDGSVLLPLLYPKLRPSTMLIMGLNPSFSAKAWRKMLEGGPYGNIDTETFFQWRGKTAVDIDLVAALESVARMNYPYFRPVRELAEGAGVGGSWDHIDLFFYRKRTQKEFLPLVWTSRRKQLTDFGQEQLNLTRRIITDVNPAIVVVANAEASRIVCESFSRRHDEEFGYDTVSLGGKDMTVLYTSQLSGGAISWGDFERLKWHVRQAYTRLKSVS